MIKFLAKKDGKPLYGFGLSAGNCELLMKGQPILNGYATAKIFGLDIQPPLPLKTGEGSK